MLRVAQEYVSAELTTVWLIDTAEALLLRNGYWEWVTHSSVPVPSAMSATKSELGTAPDPSKIQLWGGKRDLPRALVKPLAF